MGEVTVVYKKRLFVIIVCFIAYSILLFVISANYKNDGSISNINNNSYDDGQNSIGKASLTEGEPVNISFLSADVYKTASIEGKAEADTPWKSNIELLGNDYPEKGLFMMPGTTITFTESIPAGAKLNVSAKLDDSVAETGISDGMTFVIEVLQDGSSLKTYEPIIVAGDGQLSCSEFDLSEWQGRMIQVAIHCYDGGNDDAIGDWGIINSLELKNY